MSKALMSISNFATDFIIFYTEKLQNSKSPEEVTELLIGAMVFCNCAIYNYSRMLKEDNCSEQEIEKMLRDLKIAAEGISDQISARAVLLEQNSKNTTLN